MALNMGETTGSAGDLIECGGPLLTTCCAMQMAHIGAVSA
jgi:hypothetical protein